jgi:hypothetical protein
VEWPQTRAKLIKYGKDDGPRLGLKELLEYLATPGFEDIWVLLDIQVPLPALK